MSKITPAPHDVASRVTMLRSTLELIAALGSPDDAELAREALTADDRERELDAEGSGPRCSECGRRGCFPSMH